ncbi:hypothetical protein [Microbacterium sp.]|uniref:hypothetical protein n=1 Tax=Microbacterium sp. TaxID=51671 RepID=UPI003F714C14
MNVDTVAPFAMVCTVLLPAGIVVMLPAVAVAGLRGHGRHARRLLLTLTALVALAAMAGLVVGTAVESAAVLTG